MTTGIRDGHSTAFTLAAARTIAATQLATLDSYHDEWVAVLNQFGPGTYRQALANGGRRNRPVVDLSVTGDGREVPRSMQPGFAQIVDTATVWARWERERVLYTVHPELVIDLAAQSPATLETADLSFLPHDDPLLIFPEPLTLDPAPDPAVDTAQVFAVGVTGYSALRDCHCDMNDPDRSHLIWSAHVTLDGNEILTVQQTTPPLPDTYATAQTDEFVEAMSHTRETVAPAIAVAQATLAYLCEEPDVITANPVRRRPGLGAAATKRRNKSATVIGVGLRIGPTLPAARRERQEHAAAVAKTGTSLTPHPRRAHPRKLRDGRVVQVRKTIVNEPRLPEGTTIDTNLISVTTRRNRDGVDAAMSTRPRRRSPEGAAEESEPPHAQPCTDEIAFAHNNIGVGLDL